VAAANGAGGAFFGKHMVSDGAPSSMCAAWCVGALMRVLFAIGCSLLIFLFLAHVLPSSFMKPVQPHLEGH